MVNYLIGIQLNNLHHNHYHQHHHNSSYLCWSLKFLVLSLFLLTIPFSLVRVNDIFSTIHWFQLSLIPLQYINFNSLLFLYNTLTSTLSYFSSIH